MGFLEEYTTEYTKHYSTGSFELALIKIRREKVLQSLKKHCHRSILEVGCGLEPLFCHLKDFQSYTIVEPSPSFAKNAIDLIPQGLNVSVIQGFLETSYKALTALAPYDFIIISSLLHEVDNPEHLLNVVRMLSNTNTIIHVNVPNVLSFHRLLGLEMGIMETVYDKSNDDIKFKRTSHFDKASLISLMERSGFDILECETHFIKPFSNEQMARPQNSIYGTLCVRCHPK